MDFFLNLFIAYNDWLDNSHPYVDMFVLASAIALTQLTAHPFKHITRIKVITYNIFFTFLFWVLVAALLPVLPLIAIASLPVFAIVGIVAAIRYMLKKA